MVLRRHAESTGFPQGTMNMVRSLAIPLIISIAAHAGVLFIIFHGGERETTSEQSVAAMSVARSLAVMDEVAPAQTSHLVFQLNDRIEEVKGTREFQGQFEWTVQSTPIRVREVSQFVGVAVNRVQLVPISQGADSKEEPTYDVVVEMAAVASTVYDDILFVANLVGEGTLHSRYRTRNLVIKILSAQDGGTTTFTNTTRESRQLFLGRISPVAFLLDGEVSAGGMSEGTKEASGK